GPDVRPHQIDSDVGAAVGGRGDAPEDQNPEQHAAEVVTVRDRPVEGRPQQHGDEHVGGDDADEECRHQLDAVDEAVHVAVGHGHYATLIYLFGWLVVGYGANNSGFRNRRVCTTASVFMSMICPASAMAASSASGSSTTVMPSCSSSIPPPIPMRSASE